MTTDTLPGLEDDTPPAGSFIDENLRDALAMYDRLDHNGLPSIEALNAAASNSEVRALYAAWHRDLCGFLLSATLSHILIRLEENHPRLAAGLAHEVKQCSEAGDFYGEAVWEWAEERGLNPEQIVAEARAKDAAWLAAEPRQRPLPTVTLSGD